MFLTSLEREHLEYAVAQAYNGKPLPTDHDALFSNINSLMTYVTAEKAKYSNCAFLLSGYFLGDNTIGHAINFTLLANVMALPANTGNLQPLEGIIFDAINVTGGFNYIGCFLITTIIF